jgi:hypothetical protein
MNPRNQARALRYRRLALAESDRVKAALLQKLAEEAEKGILRTTDRTPDNTDQQMQVPKDR